MLVFAHAGGLDEIAFVLLPIMIFLVLQWLSRRKARREEHDDAEATARFERRQALAGTDPPVEDERSPEEETVEPEDRPSSSPF